MNTRFIYLILLCFVSGLVSSCNKWLDVEPNSQIKSSELFKTESGFKEALAGIYTLITDPKLYGKELQYGMIGVLSHEWSAYATAYNEDGEYEYGSTAVQGRINDVWLGLYQAISNANNLLDQIDAKQQVFSGDNYAIIKGETLALRAFLHFELVRLFGASYLIDPNKPAIPYVFQYAAKQTPQSTVKETYVFILKDLEAAKALLKADPIFTGKVITEGVDNGYLINRQVHLNYYAVEALMARLYYNTGEYDKARTAANTVINSGKFSFSTQANFLNGVDFTGAPEHIFGLHIFNQFNYAIQNLSQEGTNVFSLNATTLGSYYENNSSDYRFSYLFAQGTGSSASNRYLLKYSEPTTQNLYYRNKSALVKLAEMYFIIAGSNLAEGKGIIEALNKVRQARGVAALGAEPADPTATYLTEFRKEFFGEGQLFHQYKRLNKAIIAGTGKDLVAIKAYILPLPVSEYDAANRNSNR
ncbi:RagB/SusD family nutrient uptake outer membrane protein [Pedobacter africanus]|uniref:Starch-binding associating with outer membrane n=1 Tax=Pedobacter africanus TaxID=151894 RepID=A0A1W1YSC0_9SPHI|nr:RagB/SusD family nutrient uptake outer membrane protein [Pedobacter africanus]SMC38618.1 Starch-binding associating with outer membrane [Pedobacter africanus]